HTTERQGNHYIVIKEQKPAHKESKTEQKIEIPADLLPELRQALSTLEKDDPALFTKEPNPAADSDQKSFAHPSEEEFARILDFYHIAWEYEPRAFAVEWDDQGNVVKSFTPDFYLTEHDLYIELTTLKQSLVTKKNRKVRRLRELYPEINIKVLYASDFRKLIEKFSASGTWDKQEPLREEEGSED
ncbi:MAG TPA: hypothetical protein VJQ56_00760, partial [Blastocatellia bacterium]|nr:hypothetical protein [Blastocatellia bacterium]